MAPVAGTKRKRGRLSKSNDATRGGDQPPRKRRARRANINLADDEVAEAAPRGRKASHKRVDDEVEGEDAAVQFQRFAPVTRGVPRHIINTKWAVLPTSAVDRIAQLLNEVERSVVMRLNDERKRTQASTALQMISRRLHRKLTRGQPFPPSTRSLAEEDFDFEKILDSNRTLEAQLTPMLHSIDLLQAEINKEERLFEAESTALEALEANARGEASRRKKANRTLHDILRDESDGQDEEPVEKDVLVEHRSQQRLLEITKTEELQPVMQELHNHLESIRGNMEQLEGLPSAIDGSGAALQEVLFKHIGRRRYEQVLLG